MKTPAYTGGWKSIFYSLHVMKEVGLGEFSTNLLSKNTCKTCAYGMGGQKGGMVNEANDKIEICKKSMQAMLTDIQRGIDPDFWSKHAVKELRVLKPRELERLGRLADPIFKSKGDSHYRTLSWDEAFAKLSSKFKSTNPDRSFFYASGRSGNEAAFILHLFARLYGTNNVNNCSYYCHQASGVGMGNTLGTGTATVNLHDLKKADLVFVIGANPSSNHPRFLTELMHCRRRGGQVVIVNPAKEPGLRKFSIPSDVRSLLSSGSEISSHYVQPKIGGDMAFLYGIAKILIEQGKVAHDFISKHTHGYNTYSNKIKDLSWENIEKNSGVSRHQIKQIAELYLSSKNVIFSWAMGITHHTHGVANVESIVNLAMLRGMLGRPFAGLLPLRGHSNVQGVGSVGVSPVLKQQVFDNIEKHLDVKLPTQAGWDTMKCMEMAYKNKVDLAFILGGNLYASNPNLNYAEESLNHISFKVFLSTTLNEGHLRGTEGDTLILPVRTRDEEEQKTTQESMFNHVRWSDGGKNRIANAKSETEIISTIAAQVVPKDLFNFEPYKNHNEIRASIAKTIPGFQNLARQNNEFTIPDRIKHEPAFHTETGKAAFKYNPLPNHGILEDGSFTLMTVRSEGQFNSIVYEEKDAWRGTTHREVVLMNPNDIARLGLKAGDQVNLLSKVGKVSNFEVVAFDIKEGCILGYYPETNFLVGSEVDPQSKTPAFKATKVAVEKTF